MKRFFLREKPMKINYFLSKIMLILGLIFFSAITVFVTLSCSSGSDSSMAGLILMSGENNGTPTPDPAPLPTPEPNEPKPEPTPDPEPEPTPTPAPNEPEPTPDPNPTYVKVAELTRNDYDTSHDAQKEICGIQAKIPLRKALSDFPGMQVNDTYTVTLTGKASREFTAQILFFDDTESGNYSGLSKWGENVTFGTSFSITKDIVLEKLPTSSAVSSKAWDVEKSFSLMIDVPAGVSATADIPPATLSFTEFKVEKKSGGSDAPVITNWTLVNDFNSATIASGWEKANWTNGNMFNCWWDPENITFNESGNSLMKMKICQNSDSSHKLDGNIMDYNGAELRTTGIYGYGYYEVRMKPCKASGTNSSFFLYTRDDDHNIEWNEVDIEFITKDMGDGRGLRSIPQFNFFIDNAGQGHEFLYTDLEFDASTAFHVYGIEYAADHISWYVDGTKVYTATGCEEGDHNHAQGSLPRHNMQIMVNFWPGTGVDDWLGHFNYSAPLYAEYDYIKFKAAE